MARNMRFEGIAAAIRIFVMANTAPLGGVPILTLVRIKDPGRKEMLGFELIGLGLLAVFFTAIQYVFLLTSASNM